MKKIFLALSVLFLSLPNFAQENTASLRVLDKLEIDDIFNVGTRMSLQIYFDISTVYYFFDEDKKSHFVVLSQRKGKNNEVEAIRAQAFVVDNKEMKEEWSMIDYVMPMVNQDVEESSIEFLPDYCRIQDYDKDGSMETILTYRTKALNGKDDGRLKILVYKNGEKTAIRHQNGVLDDDRFTQIDKRFYTSSKAIQKEVKSILEGLEVKEEAIFPGNWKAAIKRQTLKISER